MSIRCFQGAQAGRGGRHRRHESQSRNAVRKGWSRAASVGLRGTHGSRVRHFVSWLVDYEAQQMAVEHMYDSIGPDDTVKRRQSGYDLRFFFRFEMELLLRAAGLTVGASTPITTARNTRSTASGCCLSHRGNSTRPVRPERFGGARSRKQTSRSWLDNAHDEREGGFRSSRE